MQGNRPLPRVTPSRLLLRHAVARLQQSTNRISRGMGNGATYIGGNKGQPVSRHRHGRGHNSCIWHEGVPSVLCVLVAREPGQGMRLRIHPAAEITARWSLRLFVCHAGSIRVGSHPP